MNIFFCNVYVWFQNHKRFRLWFFVMIGLMVGLWLTALVFPLPEGAEELPMSLRVVDRHGQTLRVYISTEETYRLPVELYDVSPHLVDATLLFEDRWFYYHPGINPVAIMRAAWMNWHAGEVVSGGSTITQQLARMFSDRPRTLSSKLVEAALALQLEIRWSKTRILEEYLNRAPYGGNISGCEAASWMYFGKSARELGPGEAALLAALPQSPTIYRPDLAPEKARERRNEVLGRMLAQGSITEEQFERAIREDVPTERLMFPLHAPHFCDDIARRSLGRDPCVVTTINLETQVLAERLVDQHIQVLRGNGVHNAVVIVLENDSAAVRALVGSAGYFNTEDGGQVNGARALRSPGSTLKPFIYAIAIDEGTATPATMIEDIPVNYAGYSPKNYDERFHGQVTLRDALTHSMNVPAVNMTQQLGLTRFLELLERGGITTVEEGADYYGLSLILGGVGVTPLELTTLYSCLAREGIAKPYRMRENDPLVPGERLLSEGAVYILTDMLTEVQRPDFPQHWEATTGLPKVAWKTGTSYGHRDAWAVGYSPRWTVGVWVGNFSGEGRPELVGADAAGPLLFDLFAALEADGEAWYTRPASVERRSVCSLSGMNPGPGCEHTYMELALRDVNQGRECSYHQVFVVDNATGYRLCPECMVGRDWHEETVVVYPPRVANWMRAHGNPLPSIPAHFPQCPRIFEAGAPVIHSPAEEVRIVLRRSVPLEDQKISLDAAVAMDVETIYWFVDERLIYQGPPDAQVFYVPEAGRHTVVILDDQGRRAERELVVE